MYSRTVNSSIAGVRCNMALVIEDFDSDEPWYFHSGCSKHMIGNAEYLEGVSKVKGGKVTFGDRGYGIIKGKGTTCNSDLPKLVNVYFVK